MFSINNKILIKIAYPIMLGNLAQTLIALTDTAFVGRLGSLELGAVMLASIYYYVFSTLAWGFSIGIQIFIARRLGEKRYSAIGSIFEHGMGFILLVSLGLFFLQHFGNEYFLSKAISSPHIYAHAVQYMDYRHYGIMFVCFNFMFRAFYIGLQDTKVITYSTLIMAVVNIILDYGLIFGHFNLPEMGVGGAALASVCAELSATLFFLGYTLFFFGYKKYALFSFQKFDYQIIKSIFILAFPTMVQKLMSFGTWFFFFMMVERMGEVQTAISGIVRSIYMLVLVPVFAFCATANTVVSRLIGEKKFEDIFPSIRRIFFLCFYTSLAIIGLIWLSPSSVISVYTTNVELAEASIPSLLVISIASFAMGWGMVYFEAVSGTGNTVHALWLEFLVLIIYSLFIWMFATIANGNVAWVWTCEIVYGLCIGVFSILYLHYAPWQKKKI